ncbi:FYN-binding protein 2-like, partial [Malurus melanocephalus]
MDLEGVTDFQALRAKFQNDPALVSRMGQPGQTPPAGIAPKPGFVGITTSSPLPPTRREVKTFTPAHPTSQPPVPTLHSPLARLGYGEHTKAFQGIGTAEKGLSSPENSSEKPLSSHGTDQQEPSQASPEDPQLPESFQHALQIWEETLSRNEKATPKLPTQRAANSAPSASGREWRRPSGSSPGLDWRAQREDILPQAPRGHRSSDGAGAEGVVASACCQLGYGAPREPPRHQKESELPFCQPGAGTWSYSPGRKWPRIKPLPPAESLGPAPGKPPRPPKFDLRAFQSLLPLTHRGNETTAGEEDYLSPE